MNVSVCLVIDLALGVMGVGKQLEWAERTQLDRVGLKKQLVGPTFYCLTVIDCFYLELPLLECRSFP